MKRKVMIWALLGAVICLSGCGADAVGSSPMTGSKSGAELSDLLDAAEENGTETQNSTTAAQTVTSGQTESTETQTAAASPAEQMFVGYVAVSSGSLRLRSEPNDNSEQLAAIPAGTQLDIYASGVNGWYKVSYDGKTGYVSAKYIREIGDGDTPAQTTAQTAQTVQTETAKPKLLFAGFADGGEAGVELLREPKAGAKTIGMIPNGTYVEFCDSGNDGWYFVHFNGRDGYVEAKYARKNEETTPSVSDAEKKALEPIVGMWFESGVMFARTLVVSEDGSFQLDYRGGGSMYGTVTAETADGEIRYCFYDEEQALWGRFRKNVENGMAELLPDHEEDPAFERSVTDADK